MINRLVALALPVALAALSLAAIAVVGARVRLLPPLAAFGLFTLALLGGGSLSLLFGVLGTVRGGETRGAALLAAAIGLGCVALMVFAAAGARGAPPIHDISTDLENPPAFTAAAANEANRGRDLSYPNGADDSARQQRSAFPEVRAVELSLPGGDAYEAALRTAEDLGWRITARYPERGVFEAEDETSVFRFVDDIVVRVRADGDGAVVDVRSLSRVGVGDMGVNARRINRFRAALETVQR